MYLSTRRPGDDSNPPKIRLKHARELDRAGYVQGYRSAGDVAPVLQRLFP